MTAPTPETGRWFPVRQQLLESSVWSESLEVRVLWLTVLAIAHEPGRRGRIDMTVRSLAGRANLSPDQTRAALERLMAPDPESRSRTAEGRRLLPIDPERPWGWRVTNWNAMEEERRRAMAALRQAKRREKGRQVEDEAAEETGGESEEDTSKRDAVTPRHAPSRSVTNVSHREGEGEGEGKEIPPEAPPAGGADDGFADFWAVYPRRAKKPTARKAWNALRPADRAAALEGAREFGGVWAGAEEGELALVPHPASWLRARAWEDGRAEWERVRRTVSPRPFRVPVGHDARGRPALVGAHAKPERVLRDVTQESPAWVIGVAKALSHPARPGVPDELLAAWMRWREGLDEPEPRGWKEQLEAAIAEAVAYDARLAGAGGRR